jgi:hypothetical protein
MRDETNTEEPSMQDRTLFELLQEVLGEIQANQVENDWVLSQENELTLDEHYDRIAQEHNDGMVLVNEHAWAEVW